MSVRVRFAPSPTGYLHIGGARTALYNYLFARKQKGTFIIRVEDTDLERSSDEFEKSQMEDLNWLGIVADESPQSRGEFGPYRQSERLDLYKDYAWKLIEEDFAYPCFLTQSELDELTEKAKSEKKAPHAYHGKYRDHPLSEAKKKIEKGEDYVVRFKNPEKKITFKDRVRGEVSFPEDMVGDFVILRASGMPVYNFCCVLDDALMKITHVIRAEDHLNNTCRQLMLYEALGFRSPEFSHVSLLVGEDHKKLSKRHGATSVTQYKEMNYRPEALVNYLCLLGWSHPDEKDFFTLKEASEVFELDRFSKAPALYDPKKLDHFNGHYLKQLVGAELKNYLEKSFDSNSKYFQQDESWRIRFCELIKEKINLPSEGESYLQLIFESKNSEDKNEESDPQYQEALNWESTPKISEFLKEKLKTCKAKGESFVTIEEVTQWMNTLKKEHKIKGKLLFMGMRALLTGQSHGPDLKGLISLTPVENLLKRLE